MALVVLRQGQLYFLEYLRTNLFNGGNVNLRLFKNNHTPSETDDDSDYTEADFDGYSAMSLTSWTPAYLNGSNEAEIDEINRTFTQTGTGTTNDIYGYYVTNTSGDVVYAERDPAGPVAMNATGKTLTIYSRFTLREQ